jgi:hypothetical protein
VNERVVEEPNLSLAWGQGLRLVARRGQHEIGSLMIAITGFDAEGKCVEDPAVRAAVDVLLRARGHQSVETVANTIFPGSLWNPGAPRSDLFDRYRRLLPKLRKVRANIHGLYFERMMLGGPGGNENQLEFAIRTYTGRAAVRRSVLQIGLFDPGQDHSASALRGFPCLQHIAFAPTKDGLFLNAFYATQYMVERAYGNYLGLCRLGRFVGQELGIPLARVTTLIGLAQRDGTLRGLAPVLAAIRHLQSESAKGVFDDGVQRISDGSSQNRSESDGYAC